MLHRCETVGVAEVSRQRGKDARAYAGGYLPFLHMVAPEQAQRLTLKHPWVAQWEKTAS